MSMINIGVPAFAAESLWTNNWRSAAVPGGVATTITPPNLVAMPNGAPLGTDVNPLNVPYSSAYGPSPPIGVDGAVVANTYPNPITCFVQGETGFVVPRQEQFVPVNVTDAVTLPYAAERDFINYNWRVAAQTDTIGLAFNRLLPQSQTVERDLARNYNPTSRPYFATGPLRVF